MEECTVQMATLGPVISLISTMIVGVFLLVVLAMLRNFFSRGFSMAVAEMLLASDNQEMRASMLKWFGNGEQILKRINEIESRMDREKAIMEKQR